MKVAGSDLSRVLKMMIYISDIVLWDRVNKVYARVLGEHSPARALIPTGELHHGFLIDIDVVAATKA